MEALIDNFLSVAQRMPGLAYVGLGVGVFLAAISAPFIIRTSELRRSRLSSRRMADVVEELGSLRQEGPAPSGFIWQLGEVLQPADSKKLSLDQLDMLRAGFSSISSLRLFYVIRLALGLGLCFGTAAILAVATFETPPAVGLLAPVFAGVLGYVGPGAWISRRQKQRRAAIEAGFPDALDMLLVCVEAGQSVDQAIGRVAIELNNAHPVLAKEFEFIRSQLGGGRDRAATLREFAHRTNVSDVSSFVTALIQSFDFGTSIGSALRVYAGEMREKRMLRAEEKANALPVKLALGTMIFTLPPLLFLMIGPPLVQVFNALSTLTAN